MQTIKLNQFALEDGMVALDLGCGRGRHTHALYYHGALHAVGLDLGFADVLETRKGFEQAPDLSAHAVQRRFDLLVGDALQLPFKPSSFDRIICSEVLEHIADYQTVLDEIWRLTKPGGKIGISVPRAWPEAICWILSKAYRNESGGHVRIFNARTLRRAFEARGFVFTHKHYAHGLHSPYWWLQCAFGLHRPHNWLIRLYHKMLVAEILHNPTPLKWLSRIADPLMGKSVVLYFDKPE